MAALSASTLALLLTKIQTLGADGVDAAAKARQGVVAVAALAHVPPSIVRQAAAGLSIGDKPAADIAAVV